MELITLKSFENPIEAHILRSLLENENIEVFIFDELSTVINPYIAYGNGGIKVKIKREDEEKALKVLKDIEDNPFTLEEN